MSHRSQPSPDPQIQAQQLQADVAQVHTHLKQLHDWSVGRADSKRVLALLSIAAGAEVHLPYTIPNLLRQITATEKHVDLVLGLNNGFSCPEVIDYLSTLADVELLRLYGHRDLQTPSIAFTTSSEQQKLPTLLTDFPTPPGHRIIVVDPQAHGDGSWKMRMLGEMVLGLLLPSIEAGWLPPRYTLLFDAESLFIAHNEDRSIQRELKQVQLLMQKIPDDPARLINILLQTQPTPRPVDSTDSAEGLNWQGAGLELLITGLEQNPDLMFIGAITRFCVYDQPQLIADLPVLLPNFVAACSPMHEIYHYTCGLFAGCECLPGGGTLGDTCATLALLATIAWCYPTTICEDSMLTVLAQHAGMSMQLCSAVYMTNRCPPMQRFDGANGANPAWFEQFVRWYVGFDTVEQLYGRERAARVLGLDADLFFSASLALLLKRLRSTRNQQQNLDFLEAILDTGNTYQQIRTLAVATVAS